MPRTHSQATADQYDRHRTREGDKRRTEYASARDIPLTSVKLRGGIRRVRTWRSLPD